MGDPNRPEPAADNAPVLYVEDEDNDAFLLQLAFQSAGVPRPFRVVTDGVQAIEYLAGTGKFADRSQNPVPCLVILDLNLPRKSGMEVLEWIREQPQFRTLPVLIYSSSGQEQDHVKAKALGADGYEVKRSRMPEMVTWVRGVMDRWVVPNPSTPARPDG